MLSVLSVLYTNIYIYIYMYVFKKCMYLYVCMYNHRGMYNKKESVSGLKCSLGMISKVGNFHSTC